MLQLDKERLRGSAGQGLTESYEICRILGRWDFPVVDKYVSFGLGAFSHKPYLQLLTKYLHHTREQTLYLEKNQVWRSFSSHYPNRSCSSVDGSEPLLYIRHGSRIAQLHT